ncbi:MAG: hypothetical protein AAGE01_08860 [Pseudomonadota bacterium]
MSTRESIEQRLQRHFQAAPPPPVCSDVEASVMQRVGAAGARRRSPSLLLAAYWIATVAICALVVAGLPEPARSPLALGVGAAALAMFVLPAWILARVMRVDLADLFMKTVDR